MNDIGHASYVPVIVDYTFVDPTGLAVIHGSYEDREIGCPIDDEGNLNTFWWNEGGGSCDCSLAERIFGWSIFPCGYDHFRIDSIEQLTEIAHS